MATSNKTFVRFLQQNLARHGYGVAVSGSDTPEMRSAIMAFQRRMGLKVTGNGDAATVEALRKAPAPTPKARPTISQAAGTPTAGYAQLRPAMPGGTPPPDDRQGGFDRASWQATRDAAAAQATPAVRAAMGYPPVAPVGTFVNQPQRFDDFSPSLGPIPPDIRSEGYGMARSGPGVSREAFTDAFAPPDVPPDQAARMAQALSIRTGNSPLAVGDMPPSGPDFSQADTPPLTPEQEQMMQQWLIQLLGNRPVVPPAPPAPPAQVPSGIRI